ncbi:hypothetical protein GF412_05610 [Candidatus Micrarchaeota archaeon]|nr:hypothetical protein [Candidatus Micrarchaeota archaeon]MBD3418425.1 hypothetical protein [Candidatus Micrarchaeota archaeon]
MKNSLESFSKNPVSFMLPTILYPIFMLITLGASVGVLLLLFMLFTTFGADAEITLIALGVIGAVLLLLNGIFSAGYKGALWEEYHRALHLQPVGLVSYMNYAFRNSLQFFIISLVKLVVIGFFITPLVLVYYFFDLGAVHEAFPYLFGAIALFEMFVIEFLFAFSFIAYVEKRVRPFSAILISLNFIKDANIKAFLVYVLYTIVVLSTAVPLLNIVMYLVFYPIAASSLVRFFEKESGGY